MTHPAGCPCVVCNPKRCRECGAPSSSGAHLNDQGVCKHRRACEGRQMLKAGRSVADAAAHAQGRSDD